MVPRRVGRGGEALELFFEVPSPRAASCPEPKNALPRFVENKTPTGYTLFYNKICYCAIIATSLLCTY